MHEFRWLAPVHVGFSSAPGVQDRTPKQYQDFWTRVAREAGPRNWEFHRTPSTDAALGWASAAGEELPRSLEIVSGTLHPDTTGTPRELEVRELRWSLMDHGVFLVEGLLRTVPDLPTSRLQDADHWEREVQRRGEELVELCVEHGYTRLISSIEAVRDHADHVRIEHAPVGRPLWVTRSLAFDGKDRLAPGLARAWAGGIDGDHAELVEELIRDERPVVARWLNHLYRPERNSAVQRAWTALRRAQFFWAAMHRVDARLREILAWSMAERSQVSVPRLRGELRATVDEAQELLMLRADVRQHSGRRIHAQMEGYLAVWEYTDLVEDPVREKVDICRERLAGLAEDRAAKSSMFTDIILMGIGVTSVLATAIALVQFGRGASQDPSQSVFDLGNGSITSWLSSQSMDAILIFSLVLSVLLIVVFVWKRRQSVS